VIDFVTFRDVKADQMPFISAGFLVVLEGSRQQKTSSSVSVDGDQKATMTDYVVAVGKEQRRLDKAGKLNGRENMLDVEKRGACDSWRNWG